MYPARVEDGRLLLGYERETDGRGTIVSATAAARLDKKGLTFKARLEPHGSWTTELNVAVIALIGAGTWRGPREIRTGRGRPSMERNLERWMTGAPRLECDWDPLRATYRRSLFDLAALRFRPTTSGGRSLPAAGLPCFMPMFGRDSIFTSPQALPFTSELAETTLRELGARQGTHLDDFRDEDPGRILHATRFGEMTAFEERPPSTFYGSADS